MVTIIDLKLVEFSNKEVIAVKFLFRMCIKLTHYFSKQTFHSTI